MISSSIKILELIDLQIIVGLKLDLPVANISNIFLKPLLVRKIEKRKT
jgi:hypothetical protein